jgi:hypothetical protein
VHKIVYRIDTPHNKAESSLLIHPFYSEKHETFYAFINHASEDKEEIASPLTLELRRYGLKIWYDEFSSHIAHRR